MSRLRSPMEALERSGAFADPWVAAGLKRDEVKNALALRWFLDPKGNHGCDAGLLRYVLQRAGLEPSDQDAAGRWARCRVSVEECLSGDRTSRVDIQIDDPAFFVVVEVKIDAPEQPRQLERYCDLAAARAGSGRPWAVVFLTTSGRAPSTGGTRSVEIVSISWKDLAAGLRRAVRDAPLVPRFLATSFAKHMATM
jgi:hypothetical protein